MSFIDLFPTVILQETLNDINNSDINSYKDFISRENFLDSGEDGKTSKNQQILSNTLFKKLQDNILNLSKIYLREISHEFKDVQISNSWVNILNNKESIHTHSHSNSHISGVFYFESSSPLRFHNPLLNSYTFEPNFIEGSNSFRSFTNFTVHPQAKNIILFPSWLMHEVLPTQKNNRISIAFNIIPKGEFGPITGKLYL